MKYFSILLLPILLVSCASILCTRYTTTQINTNPKGATIIVNKTDTFCCSDKELVIERSEKPLRLELIQDTLRQVVQIPSKTSDIYRWLNILCWYGYFIDLLNDKRFTYPKNIDIDLYHPKTNYQFGDNFKVSKEKTFNIGLSVPIVNGYIYGSGNKNIGGTLGLGFHFEYNLNKDYFVSSEFNALEHTSWVWHEYYPYTMNHHRLEYVNARINKRINRWQFGAGLSYQQFNMEKSHYDRSYLALNGRLSSDTSYQLYKQYNEGLGLNFSVQYQLNNNFYIGTMFQPLLINTASSSNGTLQYTNISLIYKLAILKRKKDNQK